MVCFAGSICSRVQADGQAATKLVLGYQSLDVREPFFIFT